MVRHFSKPGITGWAQVTGFRGETKELWQMEERIKRDIWYIENWSFWLDIRIILLTAKSIICPDKNAYKKICGSQHYSSKALICFLGVTPRFFRLSTLLITLPAPS